MAITVRVPLGGYIKDVSVGGQWFRPETDREEALVDEILKLDRFARSAIEAARTRPHDGSQLDADLEALLIDAAKL